MKGLWVCGHGSSLINIEDVIEGSSHESPNYGKAFGGATCRLLHGLRPEQGMIYRPRIVRGNSNRAFRVLDAESVGSEPNGIWRLHVEYWGNR